MKRPLGEVFTFCLNAFWLPFNKEAMHKESGTTRSFAEVYTQPRKKTEIILVKLLRANETNCRSCGPHSKHLSVCLHAQFNSEAEVRTAVLGLKCVLRDSVQGGVVCRPEQEPTGSLFPFLHP